MGDVCDNCVLNANTNQLDTDADGVGDVCDNCVLNANTNQLNTDADGVGDVCDADDDNDGLLDTQEDINSNGIVDAGETDPLNPDSDADTVLDGIDNCSIVTNIDQTDTDNDTQGNACDVDDDNDGLTDIFETGIGTNTLLIDTDNDGLSDYTEVAYDGNAAAYTPGLDLNPLSNNTDSDAYLDNADLYPLNFNFDDGDLAPLGNPDGVVNAADLAIATQIILGNISQNLNVLLHGDLYPPGAPDGIIDTSDLILIRKLVLE